MKFLNYIYDKLVQIIIYILNIFVVTMFLVAFKVSGFFLIIILIILSTNGLIILLIDYFRKRKFYNELINNLNNLDKKYYILETLNRPNFYDGQLLYQILYDTNKSMIENVNQYQFSMNDFKDYVEMWIHEVKIPIASLLLINHNSKNKLAKKYLNQIKRLDDYVDQVLYYVREEFSEKDYLIKENKIKKIINQVALRNKDDLLENNIDLYVDVLDESVLTDSKWLEFILNQVINNSIKYKNNNVSSYIKISTSMDNNNLILSILDNGIGIPKEDLIKVFDKSFTGRNGRIRAKSTGMGLYIAKRLCQKLGHKIIIESSYGSYTKVSIVFSKNDFYTVR